MVTLEKEKNMSQLLNKENIIRREVRFAVHLPTNSYRDDDYHYIREDVTYKDGTVVPHTFYVKNHPRPVWVTKQSSRNHRDKKEFEDVDKLTKIMTTQSDINKAVANGLGTPYLASQPDKIKASQFVYGYDVTSTSLIKYQSLKRNGLVQSNYSVAVFDIETDIDTEEILMLTIAYRGETYTAVLSKYLQGMVNVQERLKLIRGKLLPKYKDLPFKMEAFDTEVELLKAAFKVANEWKPVLMAGWNIAFDIGRIMDRLKKFGVNPVDVICDQNIPRNLRVCRYVAGLEKKVTASGVVKPINPSLQWHYVICTAPFYFIDAMCVFRQLRMGQQERTSYSLNAILMEILGTRKLEFEEANGYSGGKWHTFMQKNYPLEYIVYNHYDCLGILELDEKTKDLTSTLPTFARMTDFMKFNSQVRKVTDSMFVFALSKGKIIGTVPPMDKIDPKIDLEVGDTDDDDDEDDEDEEKVVLETMNLKGWIQLLPQNQLIHNGLKCLLEYPDVITSIRGLSADFDSTSSYPSCTLVSNVSKGTCVNEVIEVVGVPEHVFREQNLSVCLGAANVMEYANVMFGLPKLEHLDLDKYF